MNSIFTSSLCLINLFLSNIFFDTPLKRQKTKSFLIDWNGYQKEILGKNGLNLMLLSLKIALWNLKLYKEFLTLESFL